MDYSKITPRISEATKGFLEKNFKTVHTGAEYVLEGIYPLYKLALLEIKGVFTIRELSLLIDIANGTTLTAAFAGQMLRAQAEDACVFDGLDKKWKVDKDKLSEKLGKLTSFQAACLEIFTKAFWEDDHHPKKSIDDYVSLIVE